MATTSLAKMLVTRRTDDRDLIPLASPTTDLGANSTSIATGIAIGFTFTFDGADYTTCALSSKGFLRLDGTVTSASNSNLFASNTDKVIAPWWDDMETVTSGGYIKHETQGAAPWRRFVAEWYCNFNTASGSTNYIRAKFQCVLYESTGTFAFRYGTFESGGSGVNTSSASIGCKGDTTGSADNYIDLAVDDRDLGGSQTTSTTNLRAYTNEWPAYTIIVEPNWPMVGFYVDTPDTELTGMQDPYCDPLWNYCASVNYYYCRHTPALVNFSPYSKPSTRFDSPKYVVPITPSADSLTYRVWVEFYNGNDGSSSVTLDVDRDSAADPQPPNGDWTNIDSVTKGSLSATAYYSIDPFDIQIIDSVTHLRFKFTGNDILVLSIVVAPVPLDEVDPTFTYPSGFVPMGIGQFRQRAAGVHPETYNRAYRNIARIAADRRQALWSYGNSDDATEYGFTGASPSTRILGVSPASLRTWLGQECTTVVYAYDSASNGSLQFTERGGFSATAFDIDPNGSEYRRQDGTLQLLSDQPTIALTADPAGTMRVMFAGVSWVPPFNDEDLIVGLTPAPKLDALIWLAARIRRACLYSYAMAGLASLLRIGSSGYYRCAWMVPPGTAMLRAKLMRSNQAGKTSNTATQQTSIFADSSGSGSNDEILIDSPFTSGHDEYLPDHETQPTSTSNLFDASPSAPENRLLESPTTGILTGLTRELVKVRYGVGICLVPVPDDPTA